MSKLTEQVAEFHRAFGQPIVSSPTVPADERVRMRANFIVEEFIETLEAMFERSFSDEWDSMLTKIAVASVKVDLVELADGLADLDYVVEGCRLEFGIDGDPIAAEVHRSNMQKVGGKMREDGKLLKPDGWTKPDIAGELEKQGLK